MKGGIILKEEKTNRKILQVDIKEIAKKPAEFEELMDVLVAEARRDEKKIPWETARKKLKKAGKL